ncbi:hypothetical protein GN956_G1089 [Arapaima gigas]
MTRQPLPVAEKHLHNIHKHAAENINLVRTPGSPNTCFPPFLLLLQMFHLTATEELMTDNDQFLSFAKRSRIVQRRYEMEEAACPCPFPWLWSSLTERSEVSTTAYKFPSAENHMEASTEPESCTMEQTLFHGLGWLGSPGSGLQRLPTPAELMGQRKRGGGQERAAPQGTDAMQHKGTVVLHHIRDLKKKQGAIDQLKKEKWWSSVPDCKSNTMKKVVTMEVGEPGHLETADGSSDCIKLRHDVTAGALFPPVLHQQEVQFGGYEKELSLVPGGNPMMSFVLATADRQVHDGHCLPYCSQMEFCAVNTE